MLIARDSQFNSLSDFIREIPLHCHNTIKRLEFY